LISLFFILFRLGACKKDIQGNKEKNQKLHYFLSGQVIFPAKVMRN